jgi:hypothetical protein
MPWWAWVLIGIVTGGVGVYLWLALYLSGAFRR